VQYWEREGTDFNQVGRGTLGWVAGNRKKGGFHPLWLDEGGGQGKIAFLRGDRRNKSTGEREKGPNLVLDGTWGGKGAKYVAGCRPKMTSAPGENGFGRKGGEGGLWFVPGELLGVLCNGTLTGKVRFPL